MRFDADAIIDFHGENFWLDNFYLAPFYYKGIQWETVEHAFQAMKATDPEERLWIQNSASPSQAKMRGRECKSLRPDWEQVKYTLMKEIVESKFDQHIGLARKLVETGDVELVEGNTWGDRYWGCVFNHNTKEWSGRNWLGKILMDLRERLKATI